MGFRPWPDRLLRRRHLRGRHDLKAADRDAKCRLSGGLLLRQAAPHRTGRRVGSLGSGPNRLRSAMASKSGRAKSIWACFDSGSGATRPPASTRSACNSALTTGCTVRPCRPGGSGGIRHNTHAPPISPNPASGPATHSGFGTKIGARGVAPGRSLREDRPPGVRWTRGARNFEKKAVRSELSGRYGGRCRSGGSATSLQIPARKPKRREHGRCKTPGESPPDRPRASGSAGPGLLSPNERSPLQPTSSGLPSPRTGGEGDGRGAGGEGLYGARLTDWGSHRYAGIHSQESASACTDDGGGNDGAGSRPFNPRVETLGYTPPGLRGGFEPEKIGK